MYQSGTDVREIADRFADHLRGEKGRIVMENLAEGESFIVHTSEMRLLVTKVKGELEVRVLERDST
ncbi:MAG: hypothetical protein QXS20_05240 [Candidatus Thorarchaeota archaeon]